MRIITYVLAVLALLCLPVIAEERTPSLEVCFTPGGSCTEAIVKEIVAARKTILVQAYSFTSPTIAEALVKAKARGVDVRVILDKSQRTEKYSGATFLANGGVTVLIDDKHAIAHNKVMVLDDKVVITGSFNFTKAAQERNAENLLVLRYKTLAARYTENWRKHAAHSVNYEHK